MITRVLKMMLTVRRGSIPSLKYAEAWDIEKPELVDCSLGNP